MNKMQTKMNTTKVIFLSTIVLCGGFHEFISCIVSVFLIVNIIIKFSCNKELLIKTNYLRISVLCISVCYGITALWAIDAGMALVGFLKFLPLPLFLLSMDQEEDADIFSILPIAVGVISVITIICKQIPLLEPYVTVSGRFSGSFQYPNTFALVVLISELMLFSRMKRLNIFQLVLFVILCASLLYTGSRSVFVLFLLSNMTLLILKLKKRAKLLLFGCLGFLLAVGIVLFCFRDNAIIHRFFRINYFESTFVGRFLYFADAIPLVLKYPFGMGYLGYSYMQHGIQTGVYTVKFVHNDILQLFLDIGWLPSAFFIFAIIKALFGKNMGTEQKIITSVLLLHSLFDFDLQFISVAFILLFLINSEPYKLTRVKPLVPSGVVLSALLILNMYMAMPLTLTYLQKYEAAEKLYHNNTENKIGILQKTSDLVQANRLADEILKQNTASYIPYSMKAKYAYSIGDFSALITNKRKVFERCPFKYADYEEYCKMLINGIRLYMKNNDYASAEICLHELEYTQESLSHLRSRLSSLGKMIVDQPKTALPDDVCKAILDLKRAFQ